MKQFALLFIGFLKAGNEPRPQAWLVGLMQYFIIKSSTGFKELIVVVY